MNILFFFTFPLDANAGGVQRVMSILIREFQKMGHNVSYLQGSPENTVWQLDNTVVSDLNKALKPYDVVCNHDGFDDYFTKEIRKTGWNGTLVSILHNTPDMSVKWYSFTNMVDGALHSTWSKKWYSIRTLLYPVWKPYSMNRLWKKMRYNYEHSDAVVLLSKQFYEVFARGTKIRDKHKLYAFGNPLSFDYLTELNWKKKQNEILIVSRLASEKRINLALKAWDKLVDKQDWRLVIVGDGPEKGKLETMVRRNSIKQVSFVGKQEPVRYYERSKIFLMTSDFEGWGLTLTEAQQHGCVPIAFNSYLSVSDIISDGYDGLLVENGNIKLYSQKIEMLMNDSSKWEAMARQAVLSAARFKAGVVAEKWMRMFEELQTLNRGGNHG